MATTIGVNPGQRSVTAVVDSSLQGRYLQQRRYGKREALVSRWFLIWQDKGG